MVKKAATEKAVEKKAPDTVVMQEVVKAGEYEVVTTITQGLSQNGKAKVYKAGEKIKLEDLKTVARLLKAGCIK